MTPASVLLNSDFCLYLLRKKREKFVMILRVAMKSICELIKFLAITAILTLHIEHEQNWTISCRSIYTIWLKSI